MDPIIFKNITHNYDTRRVLKNINISFEEKKISVILGKSGSGKSTLLQMINGLLHPSAGSLLLFGKAIDYKNIYLLRREIGYAVQGTGLFPHLTVSQNIALPGKVSGRKGPWLQKRIDDLLRMVSMDPACKSKYPYQLSGGEEQRVGICRAMVLNPPIFLLDEAFGALDVSTRRELQQELLHLQQIEARTIVLVTHDVNEAFMLADKILVLDEGEVQQFAAPDEILTHPENQRVKQFINRYEKT